MELVLVYVLVLWNLVLGKLRQEDLKFKVNLGYITRPLHK